MKTAIIEIGNSKGLRLPKAILEQCKIDAYVDLGVEGRNIIIKPLKTKVRQGWREAFLRAGKEKEQIISDKIDLDSKDWKW